MSNFRGEVPTTLLPPRRSRFSARKTKNPTSRYLNRDDGRPSHTTTVTTINITIHTPALATTPPPRPRTPRSRHDRTTPQPTTRRARVINLMNTDPHRTWNGTQLAAQLDIPPHNLLTQLAEWARLGLITRTTKGHYTPNKPPTSTTPPTT